jgi:hypothetical protein
VFLKSTNFRSHYYGVQNDHLKFVEKCSVPDYNYKKTNFTRERNVFNKKRYEFKGTWKMNERFGRRVFNINYSHVFVHDLEHPGQEPQRLRTQYEYEELKAVPVIFNNSKINTPEFSHLTLMPSGIVAESCLYLYFCNPWKIIIFIASTLLYSNGIELSG